MVSRVKLSLHPGDNGELAVVAENGAVHYSGRVNPTSKSSRDELYRGLREALPAIDIDEVRREVARCAEKMPVPADVRAAFPLGALPPACRDIVEHGARAQGVDSAFWGVPALGVLAGCVGIARRVAVKRDWIEPPIVWTCNIAPSGAGKSPGLRHLLEPVRKHDEYLADRTAAAWQIHDIEKANRKRGDDPIEEPPDLAVLVDDATMEALASLLKDNPRGLLLARDELSGWARSFDKYRSGDDAERWLQIHGAEPLKVSRRTAGSLYVRRPAVSVTGTIQPFVARKVFGDEERRKSGLAARILFAEPPIDAPTWHDGGIPESVKGQYAHVIGGLLDLDPDDAANGDVLRLDRDAAAAFRAYWHENADAWFAAHTDGQHDVAAVLSKLRGTAPRLAVNLALARAAERGEAALLAEVGVESMIAGISLVRWFEAEARRIYASWERAAPGAQQSLDAKILALLRVRDHSRSELRDALQRNVPSAEIAESLRRLELAGLAEKRHLEHEGPGRPPEVWGVPR